MRIEFFGLPGSGKTFLSEKYKKKYNSNIIRIDTKKEKYFFSILFFTHHPYIFMRLLIWIISETLFDRRLLRYKITRLFLKVLAKEEKSKKYKSFILDEGILQMILSIPEKEIDLENISFLKNFINKRKIKVYIVKSDREKRYERMINRKGVPRKRFGKEYITNWYPIVEKNFLISEEFIKRNCEYTVVKN